MEQKLLSEVVGANVKRAIHLSQYRTQGRVLLRVWYTSSKRQPLGKSRRKKYQHCARNRNRFRIRCGKFVY